jgi:hypothetical protein
MTSGLPAITDTVRRARLVVSCQTRKSLRSFGHVIGLGEQRGRHAALPFVAADDGIAAAEAVECFERGLVQNSTIHPLRNTG